MNQVIVFVAGIAGIFGIAYVYITARHRERIAMIERGVDASIFNKGKPSISYTLKFGMLAMGIALGIIVSVVISRMFFIDVTLPFGLVFFFGGLSLIFNFILERKLDKKEEKSPE